jgi:hypothetical protein
MVLASGTRANVLYCRERVVGTTPSAVATPLDTTIATVVAVASSGEGVFTDSANGFITAGFAPGQWVRSTGFADTGMLGDFKVKAVLAGSLTVYDENSLFDPEAAGGGKTIEILMREFRATSRNLNYEKETLESEEVRSSAQMKDLRHGFGKVSGSLGYELSREAFDDQMEMSFRGSWHTVSSDLTGAAVTSATNGVAQGSFIRTDGSWTDDGYRVGDKVAVGGHVSTEIVNNGDWDIIALTATTMTVYDPLDAIITDASGTTDITCELIGKRLDIGTTMHSISAWRRFEDVAQIQPFFGLAFDGADLNLQPKEMVKGTFNVMGLGQSAWDTALPTATLPLAAAGNSPYAMQDGAIWEGGSIIGVHTGSSVSFKANRSMEAVSGSRFSPDIFEGTMRVTGTFNAFFENATLANKFFSETASSSISEVIDPADSTQFMRVMHHNVKYTGHTIDPGQQGPITQVMPFEALAATVNYPGGLTVETSTSIQVSNSIFTG